MKKLIFVIATLALMAIAMPSCATTGVSQEEYDELKNQLDVIEAKFDAVEAQLSEIREELEAVRTQVDQEPTGEQKLVGYGFFGKAFDEDTGSPIAGFTFFSFTNPDCVSEITIDRVFILDGDGNVLYEGKLLGLDGGLVSQTLGPHEQRVIELKNYLDGEAFRLVTVEIFWTWSDKKGLPLIGWQVTMIVFLDDEGNLTQQTMMDSAVPMVNMEQELEPKH